MKLQETIISRTGKCKLLGWDILKFVDVTTRLSATHQISKLHSNQLQTGHHEDKWFIYSLWQTVRG